MMVRTTVAFEGVSELILEKAVQLGLARSRTEALRMGIFALNKEYNLVKDIEQELLAARERLRKKARFRADLSRAEKDKLAKDLMKSR
ncbi:MAG: hypothetical protein J4478_05105 [Candidatus Diapherotrites archaeon]|uniref:Uncharacterized protein n=1 Tax=Candidatus Iainarchaeum sp. TaxID=3101447 RepID=A0A8T4KZX5_9ARCH|nr:hypothetical protein [Candidatus Diapherotrites archaeon]